MGSSKAEWPTDDSATETDESKTDTDINNDTDHEDQEVETPLDSSPFAEGEKVLAFHSLRIYEAKVQKVDFRLKEWRYFVHYLGWNKNWDEWVGEDRLMKFTEENIHKKKELDEKHGTEKNTKPGRASQTKPRQSSAARGTKRRKDFTIKDKDMMHSQKLVNIQFPPTLKKQLVDDCELITHMGKVVKLPRAPNVEQVLHKYLDYRKKKDGMVAGSVGEIVKGLSCYFDKALPAMLLYNSERLQYKNTVADNVSPSTVYGAEHLLRLFVRLPEILFQANIEEETLRDLQGKLNDLLKFLQKNQSAFFGSTYHSAEISTKDEDG